MKQLVDWLKMLKNVDKFNFPSSQFGNHQQCDQNWQNFTTLAIFKVFGNFFEGLHGIRQNVEPTLPIYDWANFHNWKCPKIEQLIKPSGPTDHHKIIWTFIETIFFQLQANLHKSVVQLAERLCPKLSVTVKQKIWKGVFIRTHLKKWNKQKFTFAWRSTSASSRSQPNSRVFQASTFLGQFDQHNRSL